MPLTTCYNNIYNFYGMRETMKTKKRNANFELIRIFAMLFIISLHVKGYFEGYNFQGNNTFQNMYGHGLRIFLHCFCNIGVNLFFMLSGYFGIKFSNKKVFKFIYDIYLYTIILTLIGVIFKFIPVNIFTIFQLIVPFRNYWFVIVYLVLMLISPYLNLITEKWTKKEYQLLLLLYLIGYGIITYISVFVIDTQFDRLMGSNKGCSLISAAFLYLIGSGINKFETSPENFIDNQKKYYLIKYFIYCTINFILGLVVTIYLKNYNDLLNVFSYNNIFVILASLSFFKYFRNKTLSSKMENIVLYISSSVFSVYIIHQSLLGTKIVNISPFLNKHNYIIIPIIVFLYVLLVFTVCVFIDKIIKHIFDKPILLLSAFSDKVVVNIAKKFRIQ